MEYNTKGKVLKKAVVWKDLYFYRKSDTLFQLTVEFCHRFLPAYGDRTVDQMIQAARSGKQNIAEGSKAATTSRETEIKLTNVAKASLEELLIDYEDYLRVRSLQRWDATNQRYLKMRDYVKSDKFENEYPNLMHRLNDEELANLCITLIHQATHMLERLLEKQQTQFLEQGGVREQMTRARLQYRANHPPKNNQDPNNNSSN